MSAYLTMYEYQVAIRNIGYSDYLPVDWKVQQMVWKRTNVYTIHYKHVLVAEGVFDDGWDTDAGIRVSNTVPKDVKTQRLIYSVVAEVNKKYTQAIQLKVEEARAKKAHSYEEAKRLENEKPIWKPTPLQKFYAHLQKNLVKEPKQTSSPAFYGKFGKRTKTALTLLFMNSRKKSKKNCTDVKMTVDTNDSLTYISFHGSDERNNLDVSKSTS